MSENIAFWFFPFWRLWKKHKSDEPPPQGEEEISEFMIFSPFSDVKGFELETLLLIMAVAKLAKNPEGLKVLRDLGVQYLKTMGQIIGELEGASASHWAVALVNQMTAIRVYRRLGMMSAQEAAMLSAQYTWIWKSLFAKDVAMETLNGLANLTRGINPAAVITARAET